MEKELSIRMALEPNVLGEKRLTHLVISVQHMKSGYGNYFNGIIVDVSPIEVQDFEGRVIIGHIYDGSWLHGGFRVSVLPCARKSPKKMKMLFEAIEPLANEIKELFIKGEQEEIINLISNAYTKVKF